MVIRSHRALWHSYSYHSSSVVARWSIGLRTLLILVSLPLIAPLSAVTQTGSARQQESSPRPLQGDGSDLGKLIRTYLQTDDVDEAQQFLPRILNHPNGNLETVKRLVLEASIVHTLGYGGHTIVSVLVRGRSFQYALSVPGSYQPTRDYPLVLCLHGAGFTGEAYLDRWENRLGEQYILACPTLMEGTWWTRMAEDLVLATLRSVQRRYRIDPDRVFLTGMSNGGIGAYLIGVQHPLLFAGLAPMASGLDNALFPLLPNLRHTPVYVIHGKRDQIMPVEISRSMTTELGRLGVPFVYREHDRVHPTAGGHYFPREELPGLVSWFGGQRRTHLPHNITLVRDASHLSPSGWVRIDATDRIASFTENLVDNHDETILKRIYARIDAEVVDANRIEIRTQRVRRYSLYLNDELVDFSKPVTVTTNGKTSYEGAVTPNIETLLREARLRRDYTHLFPATLTIPVETGP